MKKIKIVLVFFTLALTLPLFSNLIQGSNYEFSCIWYTDVHIDCNPEHSSAINSSFAYGEELGYTAAFLTGDTVAGWNEESFEEFWQSWQILQGDKYLLAGNHEIFQNGNVTNPVNYTFWEKYYGLPLNWTFSRGSYVFIGLSFDSLTSSEVTDWAYAIIDENTDKHIIILTHWFYPQNETYLNSFMHAKPNTNFVVLCGHTHVPAMQYYSNNNTQGILFDPQEIGYPDQTYFVYIDFYADKIEFSIIDPIAEQPLGAGEPFEYTLTFTGEPNEYNTEVPEQGTTYLYLVILPIVIIVVILLFRRGCEQRKSFA